MKKYYLVLGLLSITSVTHTNLEAAQSRKSIYKQACQIALYMVVGTAVVTYKAPEKLSAYVAGLKYSEKGNAHVLYSRDDLLNALSFKDRVEIEKLANSPHSQKNFMAICRIILRYFKSIDEGRYSNTRWKYEEVLPASRHLGKCSLGGLCEDQSLIASQIFADFGYDADVRYVHTSTKEPVSHSFVRIEEFQIDVDPMAGSILSSSQNMEVLKGLGFVPFTDPFNRLVDAF